MSVRRALPALLACAAALAACDLNEYLPTQSVGGSGGGADAGFEFTDPANDLLPGSDAVVAPDIVRIAGSLGADTLTVQIGFRGPVARFSAGQPNSLDGIIELDVDDNAGTGIAAVTDRMGGSSRLGVDHYVLLSDIATNAVELVTVATSARTRVPASFGATSVTVRIPRSAIGEGDGRLRMAVTAASLVQPTDVAPNSGSLLVRAAQ